MHRSVVWPIAAAVGCMALAAIVVRLAWLCDDACITLRCVENWIAGRGLTWNAAERVQTFTHPLWLFVLTGARLLTGEVYFATIGVSIAVSLVASAVLVRSAGSAPAACTVLALLAGSRGFTEYSTSGLENPLVFLLIAALAAVLRREPTDPRPRLTAVAALTGLALTTRLDLVVLFGPALVVAARGAPAVIAAVRIGLGLLPFVLWSLFAAFYYGSPFPVTAYAKAFTGVSAADLIAQGLRYVACVASHDPLTLAAALVGIGVGLARPRTRALAVGGLLYTGYVVKVGGDFMGTRFFTIPFCVGVALLASEVARWRGRWHAVAIALTVVLAFAPGLPHWLTRIGENQTLELSSGIFDECGFYQHELGLFSATRRTILPGAMSAALRATTGRERPVVIERGQVGLFGLEGGDLLHLVDQWLCDPLLMRLPVGTRRWSIGHFVRDVPNGYLESLAAGTNRLRDPRLARYYDVLHPVLRAPLFAPERLRALWRLWTGDVDGDLAAYVADAYTREPRPVVDATAFAAPVRAGTWWFDVPSARAIQNSGIEVHLAAPTHGVRIAAQLTERLPYRFRFRLGDEVRGEVTIRGTAQPAEGLVTYTAAIPVEVRSFDSIWVDAPLSVDQMACIGSLVVER